MHAKYQCSIIKTSEDMSQVKVFVTGRQTDGQTDRRMDEWVLMSPAFAKGGGDNYDDDDDLDDGNDCDDDDCDDKYSCL